MKHEPDNATVTLGDGIVTIHYRGISRTTVAYVIDIERDTTGEPRRLWLDRIVHRPEQINLGPWSVEGAFVSMLTRTSS